MTTTLTTRFGKVRTATQRRFILLAQPDDGTRPVILRRSDSAATLHRFAASGSRFLWDRTDLCWTDRQWRRTAIVIDTTTGAEVAR